MPVEVVHFRRPKGGRLRRQTVEQAPKHVVESRMPPFAKGKKQILEAILSNQGKLQVEQRVLPQIHIHHMNLSKIVEQIVQGIAPNAGDHDHATDNVQVQQFPIQGGILPTGVVHQPMPVVPTEDKVIRPSSDPRQSSRPRPPPALEHAAVNWTKPARARAPWKRGGSE